MNAIEAHENAKRGIQSRVEICPTCGVAPVLRYDPGCSFAECKCRKFAVPDENKLELLTLINQWFQRSR
jgi:hypothetical protein